MTMRRASRVLLVVLVGLMTRATIARQNADNASPPTGVIAGVVVDALTGRAIPGAVVEYQVVVSLDERSRCFLVKQGHASAVCQLNLRGLDDHLAVISASTDNVEIMREVVDACAREHDCLPDHLRPEQWLDRFYEHRMGSGKAASGAPTQRAPSSRAMLG